MTIFKFPDRISDRSSVGFRMNVSIAILLAILGFSPEFAFSEKKSSGGESSRSSAKGAGGKVKGREKTITREAASKRGDRTKIDFEETDIDGQRKLPLGTILNNTKSDKNYDFVKIRLRWHPEMVQSASSLDTGRPLK